MCWDPEFIEFQFGDDIPWQDEDDNPFGESDDIAWHYPNVSRWSSSNHRQSGGNSRDNRRNFNQESGNKKVITVPTDKVGRIIGKGGCKIRDLEYESKAKIKIGDSSGNETTITLFGPPEVTLKVEGMIKKLLEFRRGQEGGDRRGRGGRRGRDRY